MHRPRYYILHGLYAFLYGFVKYLAFPLCDYLRFFVLRLFSGNIEATHIRDGVTIFFPWRVRIGKRSSLNEGVLIDGFGKVSIGRGVRIGAYTCINTADHRYDEPGKMIVDQGYISARVSIEDDVWIAQRVQINKGVTIGRGSVIGAGSVVTRDIPPYSIAVGVPCRVIRQRRQALEGSSQGMAPF